MRSPPECCQIEQDLRQRMPHPAKTQTRGLAEWTYGTIAARSGCLNAAAVAVAAIGGTVAAARQRLRERLLDGADLARPSPNQIDVRACFVPLTRRVLSMSKSDRLALAIAPTTLSDKLTVVVVSAVYRGCAVPVARVVMPGNKKGGWIDPAVELLKLLSAAIPPRMTVIAMADRGLRSPMLWKTVQSLGRHPYIRQASNITFRPDGEKRKSALALVKAPNRACIGRGVAFRSEDIQVRATIIVIWAAGQSDPWIILTDLAPEDAGASWYALRFWIEVGFKALKSVGRQRRKTRRTDLARVERHWLVLSISTLYALAYGSQEEDAEALKRSPSALRSPPKAAPVRASGRGRLLSVFSRGAEALRRRLVKGRMWRNVWLLPEPWQPPPDGVAVICRPKTQNIPL